MVSKSPLNDLDPSHNRKSITEKEIHKLKLIEEDDEE